ncbi:MAG: phage tail assembly protein [Acidovorax sp.]|uniref:phage tail assembly protein n=1 Tax=Acidovorax sp. TaxID=1872122 RepID=UPI00391B2BAF
MTTAQTPPDSTPVEIPLKFPIQSGGQRIDKLTMRRGKRADMKAAAKHSKDDADQEDFLFARLTGLTLEDIDALDLADSKVLQDSFRRMVGD